MLSVDDSFSFNIVTFINLFLCGTFCTLFKKFFPTPEVTRLFYYHLKFSNYAFYIQFFNPSDMRERSIIIVLSCDNDIASAKPKMLQNNEKVTSLWECLSSCFILFYLRQGVIDFILFYSFVSLIPGTVLDI